MKEGDSVEVIKVDSGSPWYKIGDKGIIIEEDNDGDFWVDFNNQGNPEVYKKGVWCVGSDEHCDVELIKIKEK